MIPLSLPPEDRRIALRSFWLVISLGAALAGAWAAALLGLPYAWIGLGIFVGIAPVVVLSEHFVRRVYHAWNNRVARTVSNLATSLILKVCLVLVFTATRLAGQRLQLKDVSGGLWISRDMNRNQTTVLPFSTGAGATNPSAGWIRNYFRWALGTGNTWAICLIPFFCLLRMTSREESAAFGANIYTLF